jgi:hypothetical protein
VLAPPSNTCRRPAWGCSSRYTALRGADARAAVTEAFLDSGAPVLPPEPSDGPPTHADELVGRYRPLLVTDSTAFEKTLYGITSSATTVRVEDGTLVTERRGTTHRWIEESPTEFRRADGEDRLVFTGADDGRTTLYRTTEPRPPSASVPLSGQGSVHGPLALVAGLTVFSGAIGWPVAAGWRRYHDQQSPLRTLSRSRWLAVVAAATMFGFTLVMLYGVTARWLYDRPLWFEYLFVASTVATGLSVIAAGVVG